MKNKGYFIEKKDTGKSQAKRIIFIVIVSLLLILPAVFAVIHFSLRSRNLLGANSIKVSLYYNEELSFEGSDNPNNPEADKLVILFNDILKSMTKSDSLPQEMASVVPINVYVQTRTTSNTYKMYFTSDGIKSYCTDSDGTVYLINDETSVAFLNSQYSQVLYKSSSPLKLYSTANEEIRPLSNLNNKWFYKNLAGTYLNSSLNLRDSDKNTYNMSGTIGVSFEIAPDICKVKIKKSGIVIYDDDISKVAPPPVDTGTKLEFEVQATWDKKEEADFYGTLVYKFNAIVRDPSQFIISKNELEAGDFILATCTNVFDSSKIKFYSYPNIGCTPVFYEEGDVVRTLIPFSSSLSAGTYTLKFSYGATEEILTVKLIEPSPNTVYKVKKENLKTFSDTVSKKSLADMDSMLNRISSNNQSKPFFRGEFFDYSTMGAQTVSDFRCSFIVEDSQISHVSNGIQYALDNGSEMRVVAANSGVVVEVGKNGYLGKYVVVDHGMGITSVYAHLDTVIVSKDDIVSCGQLLAIGGSLNDITPDGVYIMCFVYDVAINYDLIAGQSMELYTPEKN